MGFNLYLGGSQPCRKIFKNLEINAYWDLKSKPFWFERMFLLGTTKQEPLICRMLLESN
jgi:hypothetical protein